MRSSLLSCVLEAVAAVAPSGRANPAAASGTANAAEERSSSLGSPSLPQPWEAAISARLDPGTGWHCTL